MMTTIHDAPTLTLIAARTTGALADARHRDVAPAQPTLGSALRDLFMAVMAFYANRRDLSMSLALVQTLRLASAALTTMRGEFLLLNLLVEIMERDVASSDFDVRIALVQASVVLDRIVTS